MKKALIVSLLVFAFALLAFACPSSPKCPVHDYGMVFQGQYQYMNGHQFGLFKCLEGDEYWVRCD
jgi:hypothetical protein